MNNGSVKMTVNQLYNYLTVLGAAIKCKPYSEITVEIGTHSKIVKITQLPKVPQLRSHYLPAICF